MSFQRKLMETDPLGAKGRISRAVDSVDIFKKLKQRDQKRMFGINRQMAETDKAMEKARGKNWYIRQLISEKQALK